MRLRRTADAAARVAAGGAGAVAAVVEKAVPTGRVRRNRAQASRRRRSSRLPNPGLLRVRLRPLWRMPRQRVIPRTAARAAASVAIAADAGIAAVRMLLRRLLRQSIRRADRLRRRSKRADRTVFETIGRNGWRLFRPKRFYSDAGVRKRSSWLAVAGVLFDLGCGRFLCRGGEDAEASVPPDRFYPAAGVRERSSWLAVAGSRSDLGCGRCFPRRGVCGSVCSENAIGCRDKDGDVRRGGFRRSAAGESVLRPAVSTVRFAAAGRLALGRLSCSSLGAVVGPGRAFAAAGSLCGSMPARFILVFFGTEGGFPGLAFFQQGVFMAGHVVSDE